MNKLLAFMTLATAVLSNITNAGALSVQVYNPGEQAVFPVTSTLISGEKEVILIDAQFDVVNGQKLAGLIKASGKVLTTIFISGGDPDFYFGLEPVLAAYPQARVVASQHVVDHIVKTKDAKLAYWGPILADAAPQTLTVPQVMTSTQLTLEGESIEIKAMNTPSAFIWIPSLKTALGGVAIHSGLHVWMADSQTPAARAQRLSTLNGLLALQPERVVPGHFHGEEPEGASAVQFTRDYILRFEAELATAHTSADLIKAMTQAYPQLPADDGLTISAKVATGEMSW